MRSIQKFTPKHNAVSVKLLQIAPLIVALSALLTLSASAEEREKPAAYPDSVGPFMGDWTGSFTQGEEKHPEIAAQVIALGAEEYEIHLVPKLYVRTPPFAIVTAKAQGARLSFDTGGYFGTIENGSFTGGEHGEKEKRFEMKPFTFTPPSLGQAPPEEAVIIFDGTSGFDGFIRFPRGKSWDIVDGNVLQANPVIGSILSREKFSDCKLHLEFRTPFLPEMRGQERGNSGLFLQEFFEIQILDSYGLPGYWNECGSIYRIAAPCVNMCLPPLQWQTYDVEFYAAQFDEDKKMIALPRMTLWHNGVRVQNEVEIPHGTSGDATSSYEEPPYRPKPIKIQAHKNHVQFRNIWVQPL